MSENKKIRLADLGVWHMATVHPDPHQPSDLVAVELGPKSEISEGLARALADSADSNAVLVPIPSKPHP